MAVKRETEIAKKAPPPPELPKYKEVDASEVSFFGITNYRAQLEEKRFVFGIKREDRRRHMYIIGKSGSGKTKLLELLIRADLWYNQGLCVIDPHGDLINVILDAIPEHRVKDTILVDPSDLNFPISFNPLANVKNDEKYHVAQGLIEVMKKQFGANWGPRLEHVFRFICLAMLDYPRATMSGMINLLSDRTYRQDVIKYIEDDMVKRFWAIEFADWSERFDNEAITPLLNKLSQFLSNPLVRNVFAQVENKLDFEEIMNTQKILLLNLSKGKLGEENANFFGSMLITKIHQAGMARAALPEEKRTDFYLYVDEFQNFMTNTFANLFSESRKYGICLCVAHQYIGQLTGEIKTTVLGNTGTILIFRVGGDDAAQLVSEMAPIFDSQDMINLGVREFYIKMLIDGQSYDPFSAQTLPMYPPEYASSRKAIIDYNRVAYATPLAKVKEEYKKIMDPLRNETKKAPPAEKEKEKEDAHQEPLI